MKRFLACLISIVLFTSVNAQDTLEYSLVTPYNTVLTHLKYLQEDSYHPSIAAEVFNPAEVDRESAEMLAIKLKQVLDGQGIFVELDQIPRQPNYYDSISNKYRYYLTKKYPDLYVEKVGRRWYFSRSTVRIIPAWHEEVYPFGMDKLLEILPSFGTTKIMGLHLWQLFGILIIIIAAFVLHKLFTLIIEMLTGKIH